MTRNDQNNGKRRMFGAVQRRQWAQREWETKGERSMWQNLAMLGSLGWLIVVPTLLGLAGGRLLDDSLDTGITLTAAGIFLGVCIGGMLAWKRMNDE